MTKLFKEKGRVLSKSDRKNRCRMKAQGKIPGKKVKRLLYILGKNMGRPGRPIRIVLR